MNFRASLKGMTAFVAVLVSAFSVSAQGVIPNDAAILPIYGFGEFLTLTNSLQGRPGLFAIRITSNSPSQFTFSYSGIAEEYALYDVRPGVAIDPIFAAATLPLVSNNGVDPGSSVQTFLPGQSRFYAYWDDRFFDTGASLGIPDITDNYGWVQITLTPWGLRASASATALGGGIVAGTLTQIPEPSVGVLSFLGIVSLLVFRRPTPPDQPAAPNAGIASRFSFGHYCSGVGDPER